MKAVEAHIMQLVPTSDTDIDLAAQQQSSPGELCDRSSPAAALPVRVGGDASSAPEVASPAASDDDARCFHGQNLRSIAPELYQPLAGLTMLVLSHNELAMLPGLDSLCTLAVLDISRNWFKDLPPELGALPNLASIDASRNFLRPNAVCHQRWLSTLPLHATTTTTVAFESRLRAQASLLLKDLAKLPALTCLDLRSNRKCGKQATADMLSRALPVRPTPPPPRPPAAAVSLLPFVSSCFSLLMTHVCSLLTRPGCSGWPPG